MPFARIAFDDGRPISIELKPIVRLELSVIGALGRGVPPAGEAGVRAPDAVVAEPGREGGVGREAFSRCRLLIGNFVLNDVDRCEWSGFRLTNRIAYKSVEG